jgi:hypothetical protein
VSLKAQWKIWERQHFHTDRNKSLEKTSTDNEQKATVLPVQAMNAYALGKEPVYPLNKSLHWIQSLPGHVGDNLLPWPG